MPRTPEEQPTAFSRAVAQGIADAIDEAGMSQAAVARKAGLSVNYFNERMRMVKSFTLSDIDKIAGALRFNPARFLLAIDAEQTSAPNVGRNDDTSGIDELGVLTEDELSKRDLDLAALRDQENPTDGNDARPRP